MEWPRFPTMTAMLTGLVAVAACASPIPADEASPSLLDQPPNTWVKRSPLANTPPSPRLGYEGACVWDSRHRVLVRYGGHNQGGGGEQHAEVWTYELESARWKLIEPNTSPPGICCGQQNIYDPVRGQYLRFPAFSGSHGWQWHREIYLNDSSVWSLDMATGTWRNMRPLPAANPRPLRCASWDSDREVVVLFGGEGSHEGTVVYDPHRNQWEWKKPAVQPESRSGGNMTYDPIHKRHILFGSQFSNDPHTWAYDLAKNEWHDLRPAIQPPTDKNDAVLTFDPSSGLVIALVKVSEGDGDDAKSRLETWTFDVGANRWQKMNPPIEPDPSGNRARVLSYSPEHRLAILENRTHPPAGPAEQQIWTYRAPTSMATRPVPALPPQGAPAESLRAHSPPVVVDLVVSVVSSQRIELAWQAPPGDACRYRVSRAVVEVLTEDQLPRLKSRTSPLDPPSVGAIRRIGAFQTMGETASAVCEYADTKVDLNRPARVEGPAIFDRPFSADQFDEAGRAYPRPVYAYRVEALDREGRVGGPSPAVFTLPSSPTGFASREDGTACDLRWKPNPEKGIVGYRVYRMDGRYDKEPITRLTESPWKTCEYRDPNSGKQTRRYYVVAVDALGQEGLPSSPVWSHREWQPFYEPFVGQWHQ